MTVTPRDAGIDFISLCPFHPLKIEWEMRNEEVKKYNIIQESPEADFKAKTAQVTTFPGIVNTSRLQQLR